jgi:hypothetical protein
MSENEEPTAANTIDFGTGIMLALHAPPQTQREKIEAYLRREVTGSGRQLVFLDACRGKE